MRKHLIPDNKNVSKARKFIKKQTHKHNRRSSKIETRETVQQLESQETISFRKVPNNDMNRNILEMYHLDFNTIDNYLVFYATDFEIIELGF